MDQNSVEEYIRKSLLFGSDLHAIKNNLSAAGCTAEEYQKGLQGLGLNDEDETFLDNSRDSDNPPNPLPSAPTPPVIPSAPQVPPPPPPPTSQSFVFYSPPPPPPPSPPKPRFPFLSTDYYHNILSGVSHFHSGLILLAVSLLGSVLSSYFLIKTVSPFVSNFDEKVKSAINLVYPTDLEIKIEKGVLSTNVAEPYYVEIPKETLDLIIPSNSQEPAPISKIRLLAIDTRGKAEDFEKYQAYALLTATSLVYYNDNNINIQSLRNVQDLTINREIILSKFEELNSGNRISNFLRLCLFLLPFLIFLGVFFGNFTSILFLSLLLTMMVRINRLEFSFGRTFSYTVAIWFMPAIIFVFVPILDTFSNMLILGLGYAGLTAIKSKVQNVNNS